MGLKCGSKKVQINFLCFKKTETELTEISSKEGVRVDQCGLKNTHIYNWTGGDLVGELIIINKKIDPWCCIIFAFHFFDINNHLRGF